MPGDPINNNIAMAALIAATFIGLASLIVAIRFGQAALHQSQQAGSSIGTGFAEMIRLIQDVQAQQRDLEEELRRQHHETRTHVSAEAQATRTHSTTGHIETRAVIRDHPR